MAARMSYEDPIRDRAIEACRKSLMPPAIRNFNQPADVRKFRLDETESARSPPLSPEYVLDALGMGGLAAQGRFSISFSAARPGWGIRRLKARRASLKRWAAVLGALYQGAGLGRALGLHMIDRQPGPSQAGGPHPTIVQDRRA